MDDAAGVAGCEVEEGLVRWQCRDESVLEGCGIVAAVVVGIVGVGVCICAVFLLLLGSGG